MPKRTAEDIQDAFGSGMYGISTEPEALRQAFMVVMDWYQAHGVELDRLIWHYLSERDKRQGTPKRMVPKLLAEGFGDIKGITCRRTRSYGMYNDASYWLDIKDSYWGFGIVAVQTQGEMQPLIDLAVQLVPILRPAYATFFKIPLLHHPAAYAIGLPCAFDRTIPSEQYEAMQVQEWGTWGVRRRMYNQGLLRDAYPASFLTAPQLSAQVGRCTLHEWITEARGYRGTLADIGHGTMLWRIKDKWIPEVKEALRSAGRLFDYRVYEYIAPAREAVDGPP